MTNIDPGMWQKKKKMIIKKIYNSRGQGFLIIDSGNEVLVEPLCVNTTNR